VPYQKESDDDYPFLEGFKSSLLETTYHHIILCHIRGGKAVKVFAINLYCCGEKSVKKIFLSSGLSTIKNKS
jgi:hypothetical protein